MSYTRVQSGKNETTTDPRSQSCLKKTPCSRARKIRSYRTLVLGGIDLKSLVLRFPRSCTIEHFLSILPTTDVGNNLLFNSWSFRLTSPTHEDYLTKTLMYHPLETHQGPVFLGTFLPAPFLYDLRDWRRYMYDLERGSGYPSMTRKSRLRTWYRRGGNVLDALKC